MALGGQFSAWGMWQEGKQTGAHHSGRSGVDDSISREAAWSYA